MLSTPSSFQFLIQLQETDPENSNLPFDIEWQLQKLGGLLTKQSHSMLIYFLSSYSRVENSLFEEKTIDDRILDE